MTMQASQHESPRERPTPQVEGGSLWWLLSLLLVAIGLYLLLAAHVLYDVVHPSGVVGACWFVLPVVFLAGGGLALGRAAGFGLREQLQAVPAVLLGSAPLGGDSEAPAKAQPSTDEGLSG